MNRKFQWYMRIHIIMRSTQHSVIADRSGILWSFILDTDQWTLNILLVPIYSHFNDSTLKVCDEYWIFHFDRKLAENWANKFCDWSHSRTQYALKSQKCSSRGEKKNGQIIITIRNRHHKILHVSNYLKNFAKKWWRTDESKLNQPMEPFWTVQSEGLINVNRTHRWRIHMLNLNHLIICAFECFTPWNHY